MDQNSIDKSIKGLSIQRLHRFMMAVAVLLAILLLYATYSVMTGYDILQEATDRYIEMERSTQDLMAASDYLTESVQSFVVTADPDYVDDYFEEAKVARRRDNALETMEKTLAGTETYRYLEEALWYSNNLMEIEYYAMRLTIDANGMEVSNFPEELQNIVVRPRHAWLSDESKRSIAIDLVFNDVYQRYKNNIRRDVDLCAGALVTDAQNSQRQSADHFREVIRRLTICIFLLLLSVLFMVILTARLIIDPLNNGIRHIRKKELFPVAGSLEMRYLAQTYNDL
ncbi:MAG: hypothetical protein II439_06355, partial [Firmicutes bacterium]|nr:hypothetical protein [Bacillota bacterium]